MGGRFYPLVRRMRRLRYRPERRPAFPASTLGTVPSPDPRTLAAVHWLAVRRGQPVQRVMSDLLEAGLQRSQASDAVKLAWRGLTPRQQEVSRLYRSGLTHRQIATHLHISPETAKSHLRDIRRAFGVMSKAELFALLQDLEPGDDPEEPRD